MASDSGAPVSSGALPNENALKMAFGTHHATLMTEARSALGDDAASLAPKVVEGAFVRAWDARGTLQTPQALEKFLIDDVHQAAARQLARRAEAKRKGSPEREPKNPVPVTRTESWDNIVAGIHEDPEHSPAVAKALASASRKEVAANIGGLGKNKGVLLGVLAAVVVIILLVGGMKMLDTASAKGAVAKAVNDPNARQVNAPAGQAGNVNLNDGTVVHVAPESKLSIPQDFSENLRGVKIEGAANFEVAPGLKNEFQVFSRNVNVVAKGTKFVVSAYPSDDAVTVVVTDGSVDVKRGEEIKNVAAGTGLVIKEGSPFRVATLEERDAAAQWQTNNMFAVNDRPLGDVLVMMKRWYGYDIKSGDPSLLTRKVTMRASLDSAMQAVHMIEQITQTKFGYVGKDMTFSDAPAKGGKK